MTEDRELLEAAAEAAGIVALYWNDGQEPYSSGEGIIYGDNHIWNPLTDSGDALRLVSKLKLHIGMEALTVSAWANDNFGNFQTEVLEHRGDEAALRRAIVRAAAAMAKED
jgi:hypothetical protein